MRLSSRVLPLALLASVSPVLAGSGASAPPAVGRVAQELAVPGARSVIVSVSGRGKEYVAARGADRPAGDQRFRIGSVGKTFTATMVLQLAEERKLRLDSTLDDHVPGVVPRGREITIRHLLSHRSGLVDYVDHLAWLKPASRSPKTRPIDMLRFAGSKPLAFKPGSRFGYSNTNYIALGLVIEKIARRSYVRELERRILRPLGLDHTELPRKRRLPDLRGEKLRPPGWPKGVVSEVDWLNPNISWAAGAHVSNARDLSRFYSALLSGRLLSKTSLQRMKSERFGIVPNQLPCGRSFGAGGQIHEYWTLVRASDRGDRVAVISVRGGPGYLPPDERFLLCAEPRLAADPARAPSKIAFVSTLDGRRPVGGPLYVANAAERAQRWLTMSALPFSLTWSPDGRKITFETDRDGGAPEIYVMNADGSAQRNLTRNPAHDSDPVWSPDGRRIVFGRGGDLFVMNAGGRDQRRLTHTPSAIEHGHDWSPDGERIVFARAMRNVKPDIYAVNADGSGEVRLASHPAVDNTPVWSPDGRTIAFASNRDGNWEIYVMKADGSDQRNLTRSRADEGSFAWSPDGRTIAFDRSGRGGGAEIYVMNADGSGIRRLTRNGRHPLWSADGRRIAFSSERDGNSEIYVMNADGTTQRNVTRSRWDESVFAWSPARK